MKQAERIFELEDENACLKVGMKVKQDTINDQEDLISALIAENEHLTAEQADDEEQHKLAVTRITELAAEFAESKEQIAEYKDEIHELKTISDNKGKIIHAWYKLHEETNGKYLRLRFNPLVSFLIKIKLLKLEREDK